MNETGSKRLTNPKKLYMQVYDELREYIRVHDLQPGDKLPTEAELCRLYGVSRNVLREAIKSLEINGVITSKPGVGITIREVNTTNLLSSLNAQLSSDDVDTTVLNIEELRDVLELGFDYKAFSTVTDKDLDVMEEQIHIMESLGDEMESNSHGELGIRFAAADAKFHQTLFSRTGNNLLIMIIELFWAYDRFFQNNFHHSFMTMTINKHRRILDALRKKDYKEFHEAMVYHFTHYYNKPHLNSFSSDF